MQASKSEVFLCGREYDLYVALLYSEYFDIKLIIIISGWILASDSMISRLNNIPRISRVIVIDDHSAYERLAVKKVGALYSLCRLIMLKRKLNRIYGKEMGLGSILMPILSGGVVNMFYVNTPLKKYVYFNSKQLRYFEEGLGIYGKSKSKLKSCIYDLLCIPDFRVKGSKVKEVLLRHPEMIKLSSKISKKKMNLQEWIYSLTRNSKYEILQVFQYNYPIELSSKEKKVLIVTQPLSEDFHMADREKVMLYEAIYRKYSKDYKVYVKPHPREVTNYSYESSSEWEILSGDFPIDLLNLIDDVKFDYGITISSTGLDNLNCIDQKIFLKKDLINESFCFKELMGKIEDV
jgi:hypothetical protein